MVNAKNLPSKVYKNVLLTGAKEHSMPDFYIEKLENHPDNGYDGEVDVKLDLWKTYTQQFWEEDFFFALAHFCSMGDHIVLLRKCVMTTRLFRIHIWNTLNFHMKFNCQKWIKGWDRLKKEMNFHLILSLWKIWLG